MVRLIMREDSRPQAEKFADLAPQLEADEVPAHFEETVRKIALKDRPAPEKPG